MSSISQRSFDPDSVNSSHVAPFFLSIFNGCIIITAATANNKNIWALARLCALHLCVLKKHMAKRNLLERQHRRAIYIYESHMPT